MQVGDGKLLFYKTWPNSTSMHIHNPNISVLLCVMHDLQTHPGDGEEDECGKRGLFINLRNDGQGAGLSDSLSQFCSVLMCTVIMQCKVHGVYI